MGIKGNIFTYESQNTGSCDAN